MWLNVLKGCLTMIQALPFFIMILQVLKYYIRLVLLRNKFRAAH